MGAEPRAARRADRLVVIGDAMLDRDTVGRADRLAPDAPVPVLVDCRDRVRPGGAALAAQLAALDGLRVTLVAPLGADAAGARLREVLRPEVEVLPLELAGTLPEKTRVLADGRPLARLDRGGGRPAGPAPPELTDLLATAGAVLVSDYGLGCAEWLRPALARQAAGTPVVWDPHPRGRPPVPGVALATPTAREAAHFAGPDAADAAAAGPADRARALRERWDCGAVAVTLGADGAVVCHGSRTTAVRPPRRYPCDACGAGDRFAVAAAARLADGAGVEEAVREAVAVAAGYVAAGGAGALAVPEGTPRPDRPGVRPSAEEVIARVRRAGGTVVAAGGCFDLLHAGHVRLLQEARRHGDCLVVCLNSDASVRRCKGDGRPLTPVADRISVLSALGCVDAVAVFEEDTPEALLARLRPDVWVKGGDYERDQLPEASLLKEWGGVALVLPYLDGRSSTELVRRAARSLSGGPA